MGGGMSGGMGGERWRKVEVVVIFGIGV